MRKEFDSLGTMEIPSDALYGIHAARAQQNFPDRSPFPVEWYKALGLIKQSCYLAVQEYFSQLPKNFSSQELAKVALRTLDPKILNALIATSQEIVQGAHFEHFIVPGISGGAGTSINMNVNEILAHRATQLLAGNINIDPIEDANIFQSTNDVVPSALKVALLYLLDDFEKEINLARESFQTLEKNYSEVPRLGFTQMQEAIPTSWGRTFSAYAEALSRDWWRVSKCFERLKVINLGGGAIGTGLAVPQYFIFNVVGQLQRLTGLPLTRGENLLDATQNLDSLVEVHAILKANAVNLEKIAADLRLLSSDLCGQGMLSIPARQVGSSIMPGKINPVICEYVISIAHQVYANDQLVASLCAQGSLELNPYIPVIGKTMIESVKLLKGANQAFRQHLLEGVKVDQQLSQQALYRSPALTTALVPYLGHHRAEELAKVMKEEKKNIFEANQQLKFLTPDKLSEITSIGRLLRLGYSITSLLEEKNTHA